MTRQPHAGQDALADLEQLINEFKRVGLRELHVRHGDLEIFLSQDAGADGLDGPKGSMARTPASASPPGIAAVAAPAPAAPPAPAASPTKPAMPEGSVLVRAPYLGTFYRSPKPGSPPYVEIGGLVTPDSEICLLEVMKLFTAVRAGAAGRVVEVLAGDGDMVIADQPLFVIAPE
jgi:acetyl-CoA carboxylase biotin carboxyl carrier protein